MLLLFLGCTIPTERVLPASPRPYDDARLWVCRPDTDGGPCRTDLDVVEFADSDEIPAGAAFYSPTELVRGQYRSEGGARWLDVGIEPLDARHPDIGGGLFLPGWGLHLYDVVIASQNLVELAARQIESSAVPPRDY